MGPVPKLEIMYLGIVHGVYPCPLCYGKRVGLRRANVGVRRANIGTLSMYRVICMNDQRVCPYRISSIDKPTPAVAVDYWNRGWSVVIESRRKNCKLLRRKNREMRMENLI